MRVDYFHNTDCLVGKCFWKVMSGKMLISQHPSQCSMPHCHCTPPTPHQLHNFLSSAAPMFVIVTDGLSPRRPHSAADPASAVAGSRNAIKVGDVIWKLLRHGTTPTLYFDESELEMVGWWRQLKAPRRGSDWSGLGAAALGHSADTILFVERNS